MTQEAFEDEGNYWPLRWLKFLARFPHEYQTWLSDGHTVPNGDPAEPYAPDTKLSCAMIGPPMNVDDEFFKLQLEDRAIYFFGVHFLYREEMDYKLRHGVDRLLELFAKKKVPTVLVPHRANACRPWWKWWG